MGRALLTAAALCAAFACARPAGPPPTGALAHSDLTCAACHGTSVQLTGTNARVQDKACEASGCHNQGGPADAQLANVSFRHREHGRSGQIKATCAGCHTHPGNVQVKSMAATGEGCSLCHADQLVGRRSADCRACHRDPDHVPVSSQGVAIPHSSLNTAETGCLRCHYDVSAPRTTVAMSRCATCHPAGTQRRMGVGEDLHPEHSGVACTGCHSSSEHRVVSMSSAVVLDCRDCHGESHGVRLASLGNPSATCNACHGVTHQAQQRLILGEVPGMPAQPAMKFAAGLVCRSCHTTPGGAQGAAAVRGTPSACVSCHRAEYARVLTWWTSGSRERAASIAQYVRQAQTALGAAAPDSARRMLGEAGQSLSIVAAGGGEHNLELSDAIFRASVTRVRLAYAMAGRTAPPPPQLGTAPHVGFCSYCHYSTSERWDYARMPAEFHRQVMDTTRIIAAEAQAR